MALTGKRVLLVDDDNDILTSMHAAFEPTGAVIDTAGNGNKAVEPEKVPMTVDTIFDMASCSKSMGCGTSNMILIDRGKLSLKDTAGKYLPGMRTPESSSVRITASTMKIEIE